MHSKNIFIDERRFDGLGNGILSLHAIQEVGAEISKSFSFLSKSYPQTIIQSETYSPLCTNVLSEINNFITNNDIELILYKGGTIEEALSGGTMFPVPGFSRLFLTPMFPVPGNP